jgi:hypothetical protein
MEASRAPPGDNRTFVYISDQPCGHNSDSVKRVTDRECDNRHQHVEHVTHERGLRVQRASPLFSNLLENTPIKGQNLSHWMYVSRRTAKTVKMELDFGNLCWPGPGYIGRCKAASSRRLTQPQRGPARRTSQSWPEFAFAWFLDCGSD